MIMYDGMVLNVIIVWIKVNKICCANRSHGMRGKDRTDKRQRAHTEVNY